jgi:hypothetical protein
MILNGIFFNQIKRYIFFLIIRLVEIRLISISFKNSFINLKIDLCSVVASHRAWKSFKNSQSVQNKAEIFLTQSKIKFIVKSVASVSCNIL